MESFPRWALANIDLPENRTWQFSDRPWLSEIYRSFQIAPGKTIIIPKSSQGGISTFALSASFYLGIEIGGVNIGYYLPRQDDVSDIVETKVDVMFQSGSRMEQYLGRPSSVRTKKLLPRNPDARSPSFIRFAEASVPPRIITLDMIVKDEYDLCNPTYLAQAGSRMDSSPHGMVISMGVPYTGAIFVSFDAETTAREWFACCSHCGFRQIMNWNENFVLNNGDQPQYICSRCKKELSVEDRSVNGEWVSAYPGRDQEGFHVTQFMYGWRSAADLYWDSTHLSQADFFSLKLGQALKAGTSLSEEKALALLFGGAATFEEETGPDEDSTYYLGADQGDVVSVVVVKESRDSRQRRIVHLENVPLADAERRLSALAKVFRIRSGGVDAEPNKLLALNLQRNGFPIWSITQSTRLKRRLNIEQQDGRREITAQRTDIFDELFQDQIMGGRWLLYGHPSASIEVMDPLRGMMIRHLAAMRREPGSSRRTAKALWQNDGDNDFAHALFFALVAMDLRRSQSQGRFAMLDLSPQAEDAEEGSAEEKDTDANPASRQPYSRRRTGRDSRLGSALRQVRRNSRGRSWPAYGSPGLRQERTLRR